MRPGLRFVHVALLVAVSAALAAATWTLWVEPSSLRSREYPLEMRGWPAACHGLRVAVLADVHVGSPFNGPGNLQRVVELTRRAQPDLVLLAGDYVVDGVLGGTFHAPEAWAPVLEGLRAPAGVFGVLGNHDWWLDPGRVRRALESASVRVLEDQAVHVALGDCRFWLAGVSDYREGRHDVAAALALVPADAPVVVFTHNPDLFPEVPARVILTVAGHTHGGQVRLPLIGRPVVPSRYGQRFAAGHVVEDGHHLFVSTGVGTSILPIRFRVPPEVSVLTLCGPGSCGRAGVVPR
ncbi:MAG: metallophosphoesterase [Acidobacteria bacterium]|nr:metallophosphoesterase [Acidobacteriota bacterium]